MTKLLFLAGSAREAALSKQVAKAAYEMAQSKGAQAIFIDLRDYPLPIYDGDLEDVDGLPENAEKLKALFAESDGYLIVTPEYNGFFSPLLKNVIDWMSRADDQNIGDPYNGKVAAIAASSPGAMGGIRALPTLRTLLSGIGVHIIPKQVSIGFASKAVDENGTFADERQRGMMSDAIDQLISSTAALKS